MAYKKYRPCLPGGKTVLKSVLTITAFFAVSSSTAFAAKLNENPPIGPYGIGTTPAVYLINFLLIYIGSPNEVANRQPPNPGSHFMPGFLLKTKDKNHFGYENRLHGFVTIGNGLSTDIAEALVHRQFVRKRLLSLIWF